MRTQDLKDTKQTLLVDSGEAESPTLASRDFSGFLRFRTRGLTQTALFAAARGFMMGVGR